MRAILRLNASSNYESKVSKAKRKDEKRKRGREGQNEQTVSVSMQCPGKYSFIKTQLLKVL